MKTIQEILKQNVIGKLTKDIRLSIQIDKSFHAGQRQSRDQNYISEQQIINSINKSSATIIKGLIFNKVDIGEYLCIVDTTKSPKLNIICIMSQKVNNQILLTVITVMKKDNFVAKSGTLTIKV